MELVFAQIIVQKLVSHFAFRFFHMRHLIMISIPCQTWIGDSHP
jgi:hypothetical protein